MPNHTFVSEKALEGRRKMIEYLDTGQESREEIFQDVKPLYNYYQRPYNSFLNDLATVRRRNKQCRK